MKKNTLALSALSLAAVLTLAACGNVDKGEKLPFNFDPDFSYVTEEAVGGKTLNVGAILIGDETEGYSEAHIKGIEAAKKTLEAKGAKVNVSYEKKVPEGNEVKTKVETLTSAGNNIVITNSYGHQDAFGEGQFDVTAHPTVDYISMTGDRACLSDAANYHNAFNATYQSRYIAGYVAGLKLEEMVNSNSIPAASLTANGDIKLGYVGAFNFAEVVSGYTGFFLGVQSVVPNVVMDVKYVNSWWDHDAEKSAARDLIANGALIVSGHADSTGAPEACEEAYKSGTTVFNVGYNVSMLEAAPSCSLTSATNDWSVYYTHAFFNKITGAAIEKDWSQGYENGAVAITKLNYKCFATSKDELDNKVKARAGQVRDGSVKVFDCSKWTVDGEHLDEYYITDSWSTVIGTQCIKTDNNCTFFDESNASQVRSAPYFDVRIDGITELN